MASIDHPPVPFLRIEDVCVSIRPDRQVSNLHLDVASGSLHALVGKYGEGKSTVCSLVTGTIQPDSGSILVAGKRYGGLTMRRAAALGIEHVPDRDHAFPHLNVGDALGVSVFRRPNRYWVMRRLLTRRLRNWLDGLGIRLDCGADLAGMPPEEQIFITFLSRLFAEPRLLVLDETLERMSQYRLDAAIGILRRYRDRGMSVLWATHNLELAWNLADTISLVRGGKVVLTESPGHIDRRSLVYLAYSDSPDSDWRKTSMERFQNVIRYTEAVLRDLPIVIGILDVDNEVQFVNGRGKIFFIGNSLLENPQSLVDLVGMENRRLIEMVGRCQRDGKDDRYHSMLFLAAFGECLVDVQVRIIRDGERVIGVMLMIEDVSERENMRRDLMLANNLSSIGLLAAGVAHEVNNPLAIIENYISFLLRRFKEGRERDTILSIREETGRIQEIVNHLVAFSGGKASVQSRVNLYMIVQELANLIGYNYRDSNIVFNLNPPDSPPEITASPNEIRQMLVNLIRNSIEAMPEGGVITVGFPESGGKVIMTIADTGHGIRLKSITDVFLPFVTSKAGSGTNQGLGLSIVHGLVEKAGGSISVRNLPAGGCEFTMTFSRA